MKKINRRLKRIGFLFPFLISIPFFLSGQHPTLITLSYCQQKARENFPLLKQKDLLLQSSELSIENIGKSYLPTIDFNGQASYQSSVVEIPFEIPGQVIPPFPKDHYQITLDLKQTIYDGGISREQKEIEQSRSQSETARVEVELFNLRQQVNLVYFGILLGEKNIEQLNLSRENLQKKFEQVDVTVKNGTVLQSNADQIQAEIIKTDQRITEAKSVKESYLKSLEILIHEPLDSETVKLETPSSVLQAPEYNITDRPDLILLQTQQINFEAMKGLTKTGTTPKLGAFIQLGYGRPALNPFSTAFEPFYIAGLKFSWNIWNWNTSKGQRQIYTIQEEIISRQIETLDQGVKIQAIQQTVEIKKLETLILQDERLIELQKRITKTFSNQLDNGVITVTDYLAQVNAEYLAELSLATHKIQMAYARVNYQTILGK